MIPTRITGANVTLKAPRDWNVETDGECAELAVKMQETEGGGLTLSSAWTPSVAELAALKAGGAVILTIWSRQHPAVSLGVEEK